EGVQEGRELPTGTGVRRAVEDDDLGTRDGLRRHPCRGRYGRVHALRGLNADRALAEIAFLDLHVHACGLLRRECAIERRTELRHRLDPEAEPAACFDDALVVRVVERSRGRAALTVDLNLSTADLGPSGVVADDGDDRNPLACHRLEL